MGAAAAVVSAVVIDSVAVAAIAAETITALEVITAVGATLGAIGAVTGNKDLAMVGMAMGIVGGVGSLASNAGLLGDAGGLNTSLFGPSAEPGFSGAAGQTLSDSLSTAPADAASFPGGDPSLPGATAPADATPNNFVDSVGNVNQPSALPTDTNAGLPAAQGDASSIINGASTNGVQTVSQPEGGLFPGQDMSQMTTGADFNANHPTTVADGGGGEAATAPAAVTGAPDTGGAVTGQPVVSGGVTGAPAPITGSPAVPGTINPNSTAFANIQTPAQTPGMFSKIIDFAKNNQMVTYGIMQAGGSLLSGLTNPVTPAQINALNAQADANRAAANLQNRQAANAGQALPRATRPTTNSPNPAPPAGMINGGG